MDKRVEIVAVDRDNDVTCIRTVFYEDGKIVDIYESLATKKTPGGFSKIKPFLLRP